MEKDIEALAAAVQHSSSLFPVPQADQDRHGPSRAARYPRHTILGAQVVEHPRRRERIAHVRIQDYRNRRTSWNCTTQVPISLHPRQTGWSMSALSVGFALPSAHLRTPGEKAPMPRSPVENLFGRKRDSVCGMDVISAGRNRGTGRRVGPASAEADFMTRKRSSRQCTRRKRRQVARQQGRDYVSQIEPSQVCYFGTPRTASLQNREIILLSRS